VSAFSEFLNEKAEALRAQASERACIRDDWVAAVGRLLEQVEQWVRQADPKHVLEVKRIEVEIREWRIGVYKAPALVIGFRSLNVQVIPIARYPLDMRSKDAFATSRTLGRVDFTDGGRMYQLYRHVNGGAEWWMMIDDENYRPRNLDQHSFEEALLSLLQ
jgi:hypothetical protein